MSSIVGGMVNNSSGAPIQYVNEIGVKKSTDEHTTCKTDLDRLLDTKIPYHTLVITHYFYTMLMK